MAALDSFDAFIHKPRNFRLNVRNKDQSPQTQHPQPSDYYLRSLHTRGPRSLLEDLFPTLAVQSRSLEKDEECWSAISPSFDQMQSLAREKGVKVTTDFARRHIVSVALRAIAVGIIRKSYEALSNV